MRHPDKKTRQLIAKMAKNAADNDMIGYDQGQRLTFWEQLKKVNYMPEKIRVACEADCSSGVAAIVKGTGYRINNSKMQAVSPSIYTGNERRALENAGFVALYESKYLSSDKHLLEGDILIHEGSHTTINLTDGRLVGATTSSFEKIAVDGIWGTDTTNAIQSYLGLAFDGTICGQNSSMRRINRGGLSYSSWKLGTGGSPTVKAIQKKVGAISDGYFGCDTCKCLQRYLGTVADGYVDKPSDMVMELQRRLNAKTF